MNKTNMLCVLSVLAVSLLAAAPVAGAEENGPQDGCKNYGVQTQTAVVGDNYYGCTFQYCQVGPSGAGAAGAGVGVNGSDSGDVSADASAGTKCEQSANGDPEPVRQAGSGRALRLVRD